MKKCTEYLLLFARPIEFSAANTLHARSAPLSNTPNKRDPVFSSSGTTRCFECSDAELKLPRTRELDVSPTMVCADFCFEEITNRMNNISWKRWNNHRGTIEDKPEKLRRIQRLAYLCTICTLLNTKSDRSTARRLVNPTATSLLRNVP